MTEADPHPCRTVPTSIGEPLDTGRRKLGAILGDGVLTGCNCVLHPGTVVGQGTQIYPGVQLRPGSTRRGASSS